MKVLYKKEVKYTPQAQFKKIIWDHYRCEGRAMPWRRTRDPYRIVVSEIMLQQTQVARVMKFYPEFIKRFPNFNSLARAKTAMVLRAWQGMGYNRRALALRKLSRIVLEKFNGRLPRIRAELESLPGIGKATAGAIRAFAWNEPEVFIETNIRRVFIHFFFPHRMKVTDHEIARYIKRTLPRGNAREWYWALMDYGAMLGARTKAARRGMANQSQNPNRKSVHYKIQPPFSGSRRELRGKTLRFLLQKKKISIRALAKAMRVPSARARLIAEALSEEGFIKKEGSAISIFGSQ